jgi:hypothetical protein
MELIVVTGRVTPALTMTVPHVQHVLSLVIAVLAPPFQAPVLPTPMVLVTAHLFVVPVLEAMRSQVVLLILLLVPVIGHVIVTSTQMDLLLVQHVPRLTLVVLVIQPL